MDELVTILKSLGYRKMNLNNLKKDAKMRLYAKPIGYTLFIYDLDKHELTQRFKGMNGEHLIWKVEKMLTENGKILLSEVKDTIKIAESEGKYSSHLRSEYDFLNPEDIL